MRVGDDKHTLANFSDVQRKRYTRRKLLSSDVRGLRSLGQCLVVPIS